MYKHNSRIICDRCKALVIFELIFTGLIIGSLYVAMVYIIDRNAEKIERVERVARVQR